MSCKSFKKSLESPYVTRKSLESPRNAVEPISPPPLLAYNAPLNDTVSKDLNWPAKENSHGTRGVSPGMALFASAEAGEALNKGNNSNKSTEFVKAKGTPDNPQSPMNVLATVALATSPTFLSHHTASKSSDRLSEKSPVKSLKQSTSGREEFGRYDADGRPFKRARSEVLYPSQSQGRVIRPSTSYTLFEDWIEHDFCLNGVNQKKRRGSSGRHTRSPSSEVASGKQLLEAELLLGFSRGGSIPSPGNLGVETISHPGTVNEQTFSAHEEGYMDQAMALPLTNGDPDLEANELLYLHNNEVDRLKIKSEKSIRQSLCTDNNNKLLKPGAKIKSTGLPSKIAYQQNPKVKLQKKGDKNAIGAEETRPKRGSKFIWKGRLNAKQMPQSLDTSSLCGFPSKTQKQDISRQRAVSAPIIARHSTMPRVNARAKSAPVRNLEVFETAKISTAPIRRGNKRTSKRATVATACNGCKLSSRSTSYEDDKWICCNGCKGWYHYRCAGFNTEREVRSIHKFHCKGCESKFGSSTFVRKSGRAHTAVDYAGLNEGVLRTSDESPEHHYIQSIKDGTFKYNPDKFARMRPELIKAKFFQKCGGITEPFIIPGDWNPRTLHSDRKTPHDDIESMGWPLDGNFESEPVADNGQDKLDMVVPHQLTVRQVADLYGPEEKVEVIDVKSQEGEDKRWNMRKWVDYYEEGGEKAIRNVISLEVSASKLGRLIRRPQIVRELDLQDDVWPEEEILNGFYPKVQFYCLMSVADCYTDFHIDFGGSSVYYHILKGKKTFLFIPPTKQNLKKYEDWCLSENQNWIFLPEITKECYRVDLSTGDTMIIPSGWIHAVWTPENSLVIGGNFLTRLHYEMQIRIAEIEKNTKVPRKFRYPHFQKIMWYTAIRYLNEDPLPSEIQNKLCQGGVYPRTKPIYEEWDKFGHNSDNGTDKYNSRYYSRPELDGLPELARYLFRAVMISHGTVEGTSAEVKNAVTRSIPKGQGEPLDLIKSFAMWIAWKRGNEVIPQWARPGSETSVTANVKYGKKLSVAALRRLEKRADQSPIRKNPKRLSVRYNSSATKSISNTSTDENSAHMQISGGPQYFPADQIQASDSSSATVPTSTPISKYMICDHNDTSRYLNSKRKALGDNSPNPIPTQTSSPENRDLQAKSNDHDQQVPLSQQMCSTPYKPPTGNVSSDMVKLINFSVPQQNHGRVNARESLDGVYANVVSIQEFSPINKRGRGKACGDCRRSKKRCIHDENDTANNVDLHTSHSSNKEYVRKHENSGNKGFNSITTRVVQHEGTEQDLLPDSSISQGQRAYQDVAVEQNTNTSSKQSTTGMENSSCQKRKDTPMNFNYRRVSRSSTCTAIVRQKDRTVTAKKYQESHICNSGIEVPVLIDGTSDTGKIAIKSESLSPHYEYEMHDNPAFAKPNDQNGNYADDSNVMGIRCRYSNKKESDVYEQPSRKSLAAHLPLYQGIPSASESFADTPSSISLLQQVGKDFSNSKSDIITCRANEPSEDDSLHLVRLLANSEFGLRRRI